MSSQSTPSGAGSPPVNEECRLERKKKSRGVRLSKAEREARQQQRRVATENGGTAGSDYESHRERVLLHVSRCEWDEACLLGQTSVHLAQELLQALVPLGRLKLLTHCSARAASTLSAEPLLHLVQRAFDQGRVAAAVAIARGLWRAVAGTSVSEQTYHYCVSSAVRISLMDRICYALQPLCDELRSRSYVLGTIGLNVIAIRLQLANR